jgi:uncharacterized protein
LKRTSHPFLVSLRHNFDPENVDRLEEFVGMLKAEVGGDPRFTTLFEPTGNWGGANDTNLSACEGRPATQQYVRARRLAVEAEFRNSFQIEQLWPNGSACYAANPRSLSMRIWRDSGDRSRTISR